MRWTDASVKLFITLYQVHEPKFADVNFQNKSVWETIAAEIKKQVYQPTAVQCANNWKQLKKSFVEVEDKGATGRGKKTCKFYYELGNILDYKPGVNPVATASNSCQGEITEEKSKLKNKGTGEEEGTEDQRPTKKRKRRAKGRRSEAFRLSAKNARRQNENYVWFSGNFEKVMF